MVGILNERTAIMRLEFNPRALCYNLYFDTREEHDKLKQLLEKPLTATDIKSIDNMIYTDTDSIKAMKTKLNSLYGKAVMDMTKDYIIVHRENEPMVILKNYIIAVQKNNDDTAIIITVSGAFYVDEKYADVIKQIV